MTTVYVANVTNGVFVAGDSVTGLSSGAAAIVDSYAAGVMQATMTSGLSFQVGETIASGMGGVIAVVVPPPVMTPDDVEGTETEAVVDTGPVEAAAAAAEDAAPAPADIATAISEAMLQSPDVAAYTVNGRTVQRRTLRDLIEADRYLEAKAARQQGLRQTLARF